MSREKELLKQLDNAVRKYRIAVRWYRDTLSYKNTVTDSWGTGNLQELKDDSDVAHKEAIVDLLVCRKELDSIKEKINLIDKEGKRKHGK